GRAYLPACAAIAGGAGAGVAAVGRHADRLDPQLGSGTGLIVVNGDTLRYSTLPATPTEGWAAATAAGERMLAGEPWRFGNVGRVGGDVARAAVRFTDAAAGRGAPGRAVRAGGGGGGGAIRTPARPAVRLANRGGPGPGPAGVRPPASIVPVGEEPGVSPFSTVVSGRRELQALYATALAVGNANELESTATQTLDVLCTVARMNVGMVYRVDRASGRLVMVADHGIPPRYMELSRARDMERTRIGQVARTGEHSVVDLDPTRIRNATLKEAVAAEGYRTQLALPIPVQGVTWGVMALVSRERRRFDAD